MSEYDPLLTMSALNMAIASIHRIISSEDRLVLDREYDSIINNLRIGELNSDSELMKLYQKILKVIQNGRLRDEKRKKIESECYVQKHKSIKEILVENIITNFKINPVMWVEKLAVSSAAEYFTQRKKSDERSQNNDDEQAGLKHDELKEYGELQCELVDSLRLLRQYNLPDDYRLTSKALDNFSAAMNESDPSKRNRMLKYLEDDFAMYPPYWFHRAEASMKAGNHEAAEEYFGKFMEVWRPVLRKDPYMAEVMKYKIEGLIRKGANYSNVEEILHCLSVMRKNTELEDWGNNLFAAMVYITLGRKDEAEECVMCNIDFKTETEMSSKLLERIKTEALPPRIEPAMSDDDFMKLCKAADPAKIQEAINNGANVNAKDNSGWTVSMRAAKKGQAEILEILLKHNADINAKDDQGWTALMAAAWRGHAGIAEFLIEHGADINARDNEGWTALMKAAWKGYAEAVEIFIKHGADVNDTDNGGWTALMGASKEGRSEVAEVLLKYGADVNLRNNNSTTALIEAASGGKKRVAEILLKHGADTNIKDEFGRTALMIAERNHHSDVAELLRRYGATK